MVVHGFDLFGRHECLSGGRLLLFLGGWQSGLPLLFDFLLELKESSLVGIQLHLLSCLRECRDQLTAGFARHPNNK